MKQLFLTLLVGSLLGIPAHAAVFVNTDNGTNLTTTALTGFATNGAMMDGMSLTATFADGFTESLSWADTGATSGGVSGTGWSVGEVGDTFGGNWTVTNNRGSGLTQLVIDATTGDTVLDVNLDDMGNVAPGQGMWLAGDPNQGSPGSANGWTFQVTGGLSNVAEDVVATYRNIVSIGAASAVGDLFGLLDIQFTGAGLAGSGGVLTYVSDTDNLRFAGDINPVPEASTFFVWIGVGLCGLVRYYTSSRSRKGQ